MATGPSCKSLSSTACWDWLQLPVTPSRISGYRKWMVRWREHKHSTHTDCTGNEIRLSGAIWSVCVCICVCRATSWHCRPTNKYKEQQKRRSHCICLISSLHISSAWCLLSSRPRGVFSPPSRPHDSLVSCNISVKAFLKALGTMLMQKRGVMVHMEVSVSASTSSAWHGAYFTTVTSHGDFSTVFS